MFDVVVIRTGEVWADEFSCDWPSRDREREKEVEVEREVEAE